MIQRHQEDYCGLPKRHMSPIDWTMSIVTGGHCIGYVAVTIRIKDELTSVDRTATSATISSARSVCAMAFCRNGADRIGFFWLATQPIHTPLKAARE